jgi:hypothetical protein
MADNEQDDEELKDYFVIKFEKFIELMEQIEHKYQITADLIHDKILATLPDFWDGTPIRDLMKFYTHVADARDFLENKVNNASGEEVKLAQKYNIKDILMRTEELARMNGLLLSVEELEAALEVEYKISVQTH